MKIAVLANWHKFSEDLEGRVNSMYLDVLGLVTTGVGNLIDNSPGPSPWAPALALPWHHAKTKELATATEIRNTWERLKSRQDLAKRHWRFAAELNDLRLLPADIDDLVQEKLRSNEVTLRKYFPAWDEFCADAQLGIASMAWAMGPAFARTFKTFAAAVNRADWVAAKATCKIRDWSRNAKGEKIPNPGVIPRNRRNELCFDNAATVAELGLDPERLWWPGIAQKEPDTEPAPPPTTEPTLLPLEPDWDAMREERDDNVRGDGD